MQTQKATLTLNLTSNCDVRKHKLNAMDLKKRTKA